jgi:hypothetical protein
MLRQRLQAKAIRERMLRELHARPPEPKNKVLDKPPENHPERLPAEP